MVKHGIFSILDRSSALDWLEQFGCLADISGPDATKLCLCWANFFCSNLLCSQPNKFEYCLIWDKFSSWPVILKFDWMRTQIWAKKVCSAKKKFCGAEAWLRDLIWKGHVIITTVILFKFLFINHQLFFFRCTLSLILSLVDPVWKVRICISCFYKL